MPKRYGYTILLYMIIQFSVIVMGPFYAFVFSLDINTANIYWTITSFVLGTIFMIWLLKEDFAIERETKTPIWMILLWIFAGFWMAYFAQIISVLIEVYVFNIPVGSENTDGIVSVARAIPLFVIIPAIAGPILEELVFRKVIFGYLNQKMNFFFAAVISRLVFAVMHMDFSHLLSYITMGLVFSFLYVITNRIIVPMIVHMSMNSFAVIGQMLLDPDEIEKMREQLFTIVHIFI